jgi:hypothetical protein
MMKAREVFWCWGRAPYPLDADTAAVVEGIASSYVVCWAVVDLSVEEWVYERLKSEAAEETTALVAPLQSEALPPLPSLEELRAYRDGRDWCGEELWYHGEAVVDGCEVLCEMLKVLPLDTPVQAGTFVRMPYLPLGESALSRVPLVEGAWIDRSVLELCEACALLYEGGFTRLPAMDFHNLAWHRFYRPGTAWAAPTAEDHGVFEQARKKARAYLGRFCGETREFEGRPFVRLHDYAAWERRHVPGDVAAEAMRETGLVVCSWNSWVNEFSQDGQCDLFGEVIRTIRHPCSFCRGKDFLAYEDRDAGVAALQEKNHGLAAIMSLAASAPSTDAEAEVMTVRQHKIISALKQ